MAHFTVKMYYFELKNQRKLVIFAENMKSVLKIFENHWISVRKKSYFPSEILVLSSKYYVFMNFFSHVIDFRTGNRLETHMGHSYEQTNR